MTTFTTIDQVLSALAAQEISSSQAASEITRIQAEANRADREARRLQRSNRQSRSLVPHHEGFLEDSQLPVQVFSHAQADTLTDFYLQFNADVLKGELAEMGWEPYEGKGAPKIIQKPNARGRASGRSEETGKYLLTFRHRDRANFELGKPLEQVTLIDSRNGTTPIIFMAGILEPVCYNGMTIQRGGFSVRIKHIKTVTLDQIVERFLAVTRNIPIMLEQFNILKDVHLTETQAIEFARQAIPLRHNLFIRDSRGREFPADNLPDPRSLLSVKYARQSDLNMYNVMNNVQRNLLEGGYSIPWNHPKAKTGRRNMQPITGLDGITQINNGVDELAFRFLRDEFPSVSLPQPAEVQDITGTVLDVNYTELS